MNYMTLVEIADLLAELLDFDNVTAGSIVASLDKTIGVYQRDGSRKLSTIKKIYRFSLQVEQLFIYLHPELLVVKTLKVSFRQFVTIIKYRM